MMLRVLRESRGTAIGVTEQEILEGVTELGRREGLFVAPEGAATWMAMRKLLRAGWLSAGERILLLNTGSGGKYLENLEGKYHPSLENSRVACIPSNAHTDKGG
jgi:threonine synthase